MSLLITIFVLAFVSQLISWVGQSVLVELLYGLYLRVFNPSLRTRQKTLQKEVLTTKAELLKTSAQDQFAKWAKLRRSVDKGLADLNKLNGEMQTNKTSFTLKVNSGIWIMTTGLQFGVGWWYRKSAVFYLPNGWFGPLTWWLSFPFAPAGSVSVGVWQMACKRVLLMGERIVKGFVEARSEKVETRVPEKEKEKKAETTKS